MQLSARLFYGKRDTVVVPVNPAISDDDGSEEEDNDVADPDFLPPTHNLDIDKCSLQFVPIINKCSVQFVCVFLIFFKIHSL